VAVSLLRCLRLIIVLKNETDHLAGTFHCFVSGGESAYLLNSDDFSARSSDELSLSKGDRVELIERDDDFGDGWYLGRHLMNGNSGLFPEG
jgi:SH3 domain